MLADRRPITISRDVVAEIVAERRPAGCCSVVRGISPSSSRVGRMLAARASSSTCEEAALRIGAAYVVEHGLNLAEVASTVRSQVGYEVERLTGLPVAAVEVVIQDVRQSA